MLKHNAAANGFNLWMLNGEAFSMETMRPLYKIEQGRRYRLKFRNASDDIHPLHLHRHSFELVSIGGKPRAGVIKDVVMLGGFQEIAFDFVADNPGRTLFHCHQQLHMDFGLHGAVRLRLSAVVFVADRSAARASRACRPRVSYRASMELAPSS